MDRIVKLGAKLSAAVILTGSILGWRHLEQQSQKSTLLSMGNRLEVWGACGSADDLSSLLRENEAMTPLYVPGRFYMLIKSTPQLERDMKTGVVSDPKLNITARLDNPPGTFNAQVEIHHRPAKDKVNLSMRSLNDEDIESLETIEAALTCPTQIPYGAVVFATRHINAWLNPGQSPENVIQFGETKSV